MNNWNILSCQMRVRLIWCDECDVDWSLIWTHCNGFVWVNDRLHWSMITWYSATWDTFKAGQALPSSSPNNRFGGDIKCLELIVGNFIKSYSFYPGSSLYWGHSVLVMAGWYLAIVMLLHCWWEEKIQDKVTKLVSFVKLQPPTSRSRSGVQSSGWDVVRQGPARPGYCSKKSSENVEGKFEQ